MQLKKPFFKFLFFYLCMLPFAQAQVNDAGMWLTLSAEKKLNKKFKLGLTQEIRLRENYTMIGTILTDVSLTYKLNKSFAVSGNYRLAFKQTLNLEYMPRHRFYGDFTYRQKHNKLTVSLRSRVQNQARYLSFGDELDVNRIYWRNKLTAKYDVKKYTPYLSFEVYYPMNKPSGNHVDGVRLAAGTDYNISKRKTITGYFLIDKEVQVANPLTSYIIGVEYNYSF